jgi:hypothetical protein
MRILGKPTRQLGSSDKRQTVYHVKEGEVLLLLANVRKLLPLSLGRVDTSRVLSVRLIKPQC